MFTWLVELSYFNKVYYALLLNNSMTLFWFSTDVPALHNFMKMLFGTTCDAPGALGLIFPFLSSTENIALVP